MAALLHSTRSRRAVRAFRAGLAGIGALVVIITATPLVVWGATILAGPWGDSRGDVLIVLGGSLMDPGVLGVSSYWRALDAHRTWEAGRFREIVLSGGPEDGSIAEPMRVFL